MKTKKKTFLITVDLNGKRLATVGGAKISSGSIILGYRHNLTGENGEKVTEAFLDAGGMSLPVRNKKKFVNWIRQGNLTEGDVIVLKIGVGSNASRAKSVS